MTVLGATLRLAVVALVAAYLLTPAAFEPLLRPLAPQGAPAVYPYANLLALALNHLALAGAATAVSGCVATALAIAVTRPAGAGLVPLSRALVNVAQAFPPVAVLALVVPLVGFGQTPTLIALAFYGLLPVFENACAGLAETPGAVREAALAAGMTRGQSLRQVELPLALPNIIAGLRLSAVIGFATATIGSTVAAKTLGEVVIAGLASGNTAYVVQGALSIAAIAFLISEFFQFLGDWAATSAGRSPE